MPFSPTNPPKLAGDYTRFVVQRARTVPPSAGATVALPIVDDWGPEKIVTPIDSFPEYLSKFGDPIDPVNPSPGFIAAYNAFRGSGDQEPGAGRILFYRMVGSAGAAASKTVTPFVTTASLTFTARYKGVRGNQYKIEVVANATNPTTQVDVRVYYGATLVDSYKGYSASQMVQLQTDFNAKSNKDPANLGPLTITAAVNGSSTIQPTAASALTGGNSGTTLLLADWTTMMTAYEPQTFGFMAPYDLTDAPTVAALVAWTITKNTQERSKRFTLVQGGAAGEAYSAAVTRSGLSNDPNIVNWGVGTYFDSTLGLNLSTSQLAPRLAGVLSQRQDRSSITFAPLEDLSIIIGPADTEIASSLTDGVVLCALGTGGVRFEKGVTTFTTLTDADRPFDTFSRIKYVITMQDFERSNKTRNESGNIIGKLPVNNDTRESLVSDAQKDLDARVAAKTIQGKSPDGSYVPRVVLSSSPAPSDDQEFVALDWFAKFGRSLEQVRNTFYVS